MNEKYDFRFRCLPKMEVFKIITYTFVEFKKGRGFSAAGQSIMWREREREREKERKRVRERERVKEK